MRLASSKTMLFLNDSWMAQLGSESISQKPTSIGRLSARGEAASRSETVCITQTRQKQQTVFAGGFPSCLTPTCAVFMQPAHVGLKAI